MLMSCAPASQQNMIASCGAGADISSDIQSCQSSNFAQEKGITSSEFSSNPQNHCNRSVRIDAEKSGEQRKAKKRNPVYRPLTEEDEDLLLLGINKEDRLPLALPKPPPAALLRPCNENRTNVTHDKATPVTSADSVSKIQQCNTEVHNASSSKNHNRNSKITQPTTAAQVNVKLAQQQNLNSPNVQGNFPVSYENYNMNYSHNMIAQSANPMSVPSSQKNSGFMDANLARQQNVKFPPNPHLNFPAPCNPVNAPASQQDYNFMYDVNVAQQQNVNYSPNVQANFATSCKPVSSSNMQHSHTYPYNSNMGGNFMMPNEPLTNNMTPFRGAQVPPPRQFQNPPPHVGYTYQGVSLPECVNRNPGNFRCGRYPPNQFPPPNVNCGQNYCSPGLQRDIGPRARMPRPILKNKWQQKQNKVKVDKEKPVCTEKELLSPERAGKEPAESSTSNKSVPPKDSKEDHPVSSKEKNSSFEDTACNSNNEKLSVPIMLDNDPSKRNDVAEGKDKEFSEIPEKSLSWESECSRSSLARLEEGCATSGQDVTAVEKAAKEHGTKSVVAHDSQQSLNFDASAVATENTTTSVRCIPVSALCESSVKVKQGTVKRHVDTLTAEVQECTDSVLQGSVSSPVKSAMNTQESTISK